MHSICTYSAVNGGRWVYIPTLYTRELFHLTKGFSIFMYLYAMAKKNTYSKVDEFYRIDMYTCYRWCLHNGIKIYCVALKNGMYHIEVDDNGLLKNSNQEYTKKEVYKKIWEAYCYMYDKYFHTT